MLRDGFELMIVGMGVVFAFLALLVFCISLAARILRRFSDDEPEAKPTIHAPSPSVPSRALVAAAVAAARRARDRRARDQSR